MDPVTCQRCHGLMHPIDPLDPLDVLRSDTHEHMRAWRCFTCGDLIDRVIMQNRIRPMHQQGARKGCLRATRCLMSGMWNGRYGDSDLARSLDPEFPVSGSRMPVNLKPET